MKEEDFNGINTEEAKRQFEARKKMQEQHLEEHFGDQRRRELELFDCEQNFAVLNFILTLHDFSHLKGMDLLNAIQRMMVVHYNKFESEVRKIVEVVGDETLRKAGIDMDNLFPTEYCTRGLHKVQEAARQRARMGKYDIKLVKPNDKIKV